MSAVFGQTARNLLEAALVREKPVENLGNALWLYVRLLTASNFRGLLSRHIDNLAADLSVSTERIERWLKRLTDAGLTEIQSPAPFLVIKLGMWSDRDVKSVDSPPPTYSPAIELLHTKQLNSSYRQSGAHWPIDAALLGEILETLGETDGKSFEKAVDLYSPHVIRSALDRVRRAKGIRKSRTALFRHLLPRLARDEHRFDEVT
jgi:hypothetical protein